METTTPDIMENFIMDPIMVKMEDLSEEMDSVPMVKDDWMPLLKWEPDEEEILLEWNRLDGDIKPAPLPCVQDRSVVFVEPNTAYVNGEHNYNSVNGTSPSYDAAIGTTSANWLESSFDFNYYNLPAENYFGNDDGTFAMANQPQSSEPYMPFETINGQSSVLNEIPFNLDDILPSHDMEELNQHFAQPEVTTNEADIYAEISRECTAIEERQSSSSPDSIISNDTTDSDYVAESPAPRSTRKHRRGDSDTVPTRTGGKVSLRKKEQNRAAALRYREKKRLERQSLYNESEQLEKNNAALKTKVHSLESEIEYLKTLMREVGMRLPL